MKTVFFFLALALLTTACSKSKEATAQANIAGFWKGTYDNGGAYAMLFRADGTVRVFANSTDTAVAKKGEGTYEVTASNTVTGKYRYMSTGTNYTITSSLDAARTSVTGTYTQTDGIAKGIFTLNKQ